MRAAPRFASSLVVVALLGACGDPIVGGSPLENTPPTVAPIGDLVTNEDTPVSTDVVLTDAESTEVIVVTATSSDQSVIADSGIVITGNGDTRTITLTPVLNASGTVTITVTIADEDDYVLTETFVVEVLPIDDPPVITAIADVTIDEDEMTSPIAFTVSDVDTPLADVVVEAASSDTTLLPNAGVVLTGGPGAYTLVLVPEANGFGASTISVSASDATTTTIEDFVLTVLSVNDVPTISDVADLVTNEDTSTGPIPFTITDVESVATLTVTASTSDAAVVPTSAVTILCDALGACTVEVEPAPNMYGPVTITLTVSDGEDSAEDVFVLTVLPVDDAPLISAIADQTIPEDGTTGPLTFTVTAVDQDDDEADFTLDATSGDTTVIPEAAANIAFGGAGPSRTITITPAPNQFGGPVLITITVTDDDGLTASETFTVDVTTVNDAPTFTSVPADQMLLEDAANATRAVTIDDTDVEDPEAGLVFTATSSDPTILAVTTGGAGANRTVILDPQLNRFGTVTVTLVVSDGIDSTTTSFDVAVTQVNDAPVITGPADVTVGEDSDSTSIAITVTDVDRGDGGFPAQTPLQNLTVSAVVTAESTPGLINSVTPTFDMVTGVRTLVVAYDDDVNGTATITVTVTDDGPGTLSDSITIAFEIEPQDDPPQVEQVANQTGAAQMLEDTARTLTFEVWDIDLPAQTLTATALSSNDTIIPDGNLGVVVTPLAPLPGQGSRASVALTITPAPNQFGNGTTITVTASDGLAPFTTMSFVVNVAPVNDAPTISAITSQTVAEDSGSHVINFTVSDVDDVVDCANVSVSTSGTIVATRVLSLPNTGDAGQCSLTFTTIADAVGTMNVQLVATDDAPLASAPRNFTFTTTNVNDPPTIVMVSPDPQSTAEDTTSAPVSFTVTDIDNGPCTLTLSSTTTNATLLATRTFAGGCTPVGNSATRTVTVTPGLNQFGSGSTITVTATDAGGLFASFTFTMNVTPVNDAPTISDVANVNVAEDANPAPTVAFTIGDVDDTVTCAAVTVSSTNAALATIAITGAGTSCTATFTVPPNANGTATVTLTVTDPSLLTDTDTFDFTVTAQNDPPEIAAIADDTLAEDGSIVVSFTVTDIDTPPCSLTLSATTDDATLFPDLTNFSDVASCVAVGNDATRSITIAPAADENGLGSTITITVSDGAGNDASTFTLDVTPVNDAPVGVDDAFNVTANTTLELGNLVANDTDVDVPTVLSAVAETITQPGEGTLVIDADGTFTYTPPAGVTGDSFTFTYTVRDDAMPALTDTAEVTFTITGPIVWYVNNANPAAGDGTNLNPFQALASAETASDVGQTIIVQCGDGTDNHYDAGIDLQDGQILTGAANGPFGGACTRPTLSGALAIGLADGNTVTNFAIDGATTAIQGNGIGGATTLSNVAISGSGTGVRITGSDMGASVSLGTVTVTGGTAVGFHLDDAGTVSGSGTLSASMTTGAPLLLRSVALAGDMTFSTVGTTALSSGTAVTIDDVTGGAVEVTSVSVTTSSAANGVVIADSVVSIDGGTVSSARQALAISNSDVAVSLASVEVVAGGADAITVSGSTGAVTIADVALAVDDFVAVDVSAAPGTFTFTIEDGTIDVTGADGRAFVANDVDLDVTLATLDATGNGDETTVSTTNTSGRFSVAGGTITDGLSFAGGMDVSFSDVDVSSTPDEAFVVDGATSVVLSGCTFSSNGASAFDGTIEITGTADVSITDTTIEDASGAGIDVVASADMNGISLSNVAVTRVADGTDGFVLSIDPDVTVTAVTLDGLRCTDLTGECVGVTAEGSTTLTITDMDTSGVGTALAITQGDDADVAVTVGDGSLFVGSGGDAVALATTTASLAGGSLVFTANDLIIGTSGTDYSGSINGIGVNAEQRGASHIRLVLQSAFRVFRAGAGGVNLQALGSAAGGIALVMTGATVEGVAPGTPSGNGLTLTTGATGRICTDVRTSTLRGERTMQVTVAAGGAVTVPGFMVLGTDMSPAHALHRVMTTAPLSNIMATGPAGVGVTGTITAAASCP